MLALGFWISTAKSTADKYSIIEVNTKRSYCPEKGEATTRISSMGRTTTPKVMAGIEAPDRRWRTIN